MPVTRGRRSPWVLLAAGALLSPLVCPAASPGGFRGPGVAFDLQGFVAAALAQGRDTVVVPPGRYRVAPHHGECLALRHLRGVRILCDGVEMICTETTRALTISDCVNVTVRGLSIDYDPLPFTQGRLVALSADKAVHDIELTAGYPLSDTATTFKYEIFRPDTLTHRCGEYGLSKLERPDPTHLRLTRRQASPSDPEQVGDIIAIGSADAPGGSLPHAVAVEASQGVRLESLTVAASNCFGFLETGCAGTIYDHCRVVRRSLETDPIQRAAPRIRSLNADAFHSLYASLGPAYLACTAEYMGDDGLNICGDYHLITASAGRVLRVLSKQPDGIDLAPGTRVELLAYDGQREPDATVRQLARDSAVTAAERQFIARQLMEPDLKEALAHTKAFRITLDRDVALPPGSVIGSTSRTGNGFVVRGCRFGDNRSRGLVIKASDGVIEGNTLSGNAMTAILVAPEWWWLESGCSQNVTISGNTIRDCGDVAIAVYAFGGARGVAPAGAHHNITIRDNRLSGCPLPTILVTSTTGLRLGPNTSVAAEGRTVSEWTSWAFGLLGRKLEPVMTINCLAAPAAAISDPAP